MAAARRIMAVMGPEVSADGGALAEQDRTLLEAYDSGRLAGDLGIFVEWQGAMGRGMGKRTSE